MTEKEELTDKEKSKEESELEENIKKIEEEIQDEEEIFDEDIIPFIPSAKSKNSTLQRINFSEETANLEGNLKEIVPDIPESEEDEFKYGNEKIDEEKKYSIFDNEFSLGIVDSVEKLRSRKNLREIEFVKAKEKNSLEDFEKYETIRKLEKEDFLKSDLEKKEIKYKVK